MAAEKKRLKAEAKEKPKGKRKAVKPQAKAKKRLKSSDGSALPTHNAEEDALENGVKEESVVIEVAEEVESIGVREVEEEQPQLKSNDIGQMADSSASAEQAGVPPLAVSIDNSEVPQPPLDSGACAEQASVPTLAEPPVSIDNSEVLQPPLDSGACAEQAGVPPLAEPAVSTDNSEVPQPPLDSGACAEPAGAPPASSSAASSSSAPAAPPAPEEPARPRGPKAASLRLLVWTDIDCPSCHSTAGQIKYSPGPGRLGASDPPCWFMRVNQRPDGGWPNQGAHFRRRSVSVVGGEDKFAISWVLKNKTCCKGSV